MTNTQLLNEEIRRSGFKKGYIASKLGITRHGFQKKVENKNQFKPTEIKILCTILNIASLEKKETIFFDN